MKGCLKQSGGNWVLAAENGQSVNLQGDSSMLKPHDGHQVQISGTRSSDGSVQVSSVSMISESCTSNQAATSTDNSASGAAAGAATGAATDAAAAGSQAADKTADAASSTAGNAADATKTAAGEAAGATKEAAADTANAAQGNPTSAQTTPDQSQQPPAAQQPPASTAPGATTPDQNAAAPDKSAAADQTASADKKLPQTASPLPLLGLLGFGSLAAGLIGRKKK